MQLIVLFSGTPGSGKSLKSVQVACQWLRDGLTVIANFPLYFTEKEKKKGWAQRYHYWPNEQITIDRLLEFSLETGMIEKKKENQCLVIIDEAGGRFNARNFQDRSRQEWIDFFSQHRKVGYSFLLIAQNDRMLDRQIRGFIETEYKHRKLNRFGIFALLPFTMFVQVEIWYAIKHRVGASYFLYSKRWGDKYDHMQMFAGFQLKESLLAKIKAKREGVPEEIPDGNKVPINVALASDGKE